MFTYLFCLIQCFAYCGFNISSLSAQKIDSEAHYNANLEEEEGSEEDDAEYIDEKFIIEGGEGDEEN